METAEAITTIGSIVFLFILVASIFCGLLDYANWRDTRKKKHTLMGKARWSPSYWTRSFVARFAVKRTKQIWHYLIRLIYPIVKSMRLGFQSIRAIRAVFIDGDMWLSSARFYLPGTHLTQVWCRMCSNQRLGVWMDRLPDSETGEPLTNRPHKSLCLDCYNKVPKDKRALYTLSWTEYSTPFNDDDEREREIEMDDIVPITTRDRSSFWTQRLDAQINGEGVMAPFPPISPPTFVDLSEDTNGER